MELVDPGGHNIRAAGGASQTDYQTIHGTADHAGGHRAQDLRRTGVIGDAAEKIQFSQPQRHTGKDQDE